MKNKTKVGLNMATDLVEKLDQIAKETYRNRSQTIEALVAHGGIEGLKLTKAQALKIKELESELILLRSNLPIAVPEISQDLIAQNTELTKQVENQKNIITDILASINAIESPMDVVMEYLGKVQSNVNDIKDIL